MKKAISILTLTLFIVSGLIAQNTDTSMNNNFDSIKSELFGTWNLDYTIFSGSEKNTDQYYWTLSISFNKNGDSNWTSIMKIHVRLENGEEEIEHVRNTRKGTLKLLDDIAFVEYETFEMYKKFKKGEMTNIDALTKFRIVKGSDNLITLHSDLGYEIGLVRLTNQDNTDN